jgi:hypothetical protein
MRPGFRPATDAEYREDYMKRSAAIDAAEESGTHSAREIAAAREALQTFAGYPRLISVAPEPDVSQESDRV